LANQAPTSGLRAAVRALGQLGCPGATASDDLRAAYSAAMVDYARVATILLDPTTGPGIDRKLTGAHRTARQKAP
jgi:hypothetical protein